jgi:hypothetical protein
MKMTVKNYKHMNIGHEGGALKCDLFIDGVLAAKVENMGDGGPNRYQWVGYASQWMTPANVQAFVDAQPEQKMAGMMCKPDLDCLVDDAIFDFQVAKKVAARCKKVLVFTLPTDEKGTLREMKSPYTAACAAWVRSKYPNAIIYNETLAA